MPLVIREETQEEDVGPSLTDPEVLAALKLLVTARDALQVRRHAARSDDPAAGERRLAEIDAEIAVADRALGQALTAAIADEFKRALSALARRLYWPMRALSDGHDGSSFVAHLMRSVECRYLDDGNAWARPWPPLFDELPDGTPYSREVVWDRLLAEIRAGGRSSSAPSEGAPETCPQHPPKPRENGAETRALRTTSEQETPNR